MPLDFTGIYKLSDVNQNYIRSPQIAMAPRKVKLKDPDSGEVLEQYQFLIPNEVNLGHTISGEIETDTDKAFELKDTERKSDDGKPILWRFEPLTLKLWNEMGEHGDVNGWGTLKDKIKDDDALLDFYRHEWLLTRLEWWHEHPNAVEAKSETEKPTE